MNNTKSKYQIRHVWYEYEMWEPFPARHVYTDRIRTILAWCDEQFGPAGSTNNVWTRWSMSYSNIRFRHEKDYIFFMLKWA